MTTISNHLPAYPSKHVLSKLSPFQLTTLTNSIYSRIVQVIALPSQHRDTESVKRFVQTYVKDAAVKELDDTIWGDDIGSDAVERLKKSSKVERAIRRETLKLVDVVVQDATSSIGTGGGKGRGETVLKDFLDLQTILDLCIVYTPTHPKRLRSILQAVFDAKQLGHPLIDSIKSELIPAFTLLLASSYSRIGSGASDAQPELRTQPGLYALRKTSHCIISLFRVLPSSAVRRIFCDILTNGEENTGRKFLLSIASAYGIGLESIARNYGGLRSFERIVSSSNPRETAEDWEKLWVETKAAFVDVFHISFKAMLDDLTEAGKAAAGGSNARRLAGAIENVFGLIYALLELPYSDSTSNDNTTHPQRAIPFLNRSLLEDYQHAYDMARTLSSSLNGSGERDARLDHLEVVLRSFEDNLETQGSTAGGESGKDAGVLKILLKSSGVPLGIGVNNLGKGKSTNVSKGNSAGEATITALGVAEKGKGKAKEVTKPLDPVMESKVDQVLDILPDYSREHIRALLEIGDESYPFRGDPERVIAALLEGTAPDEEELERLSSLGGTSGAMAEYRSEHRYEEPQPASSPVELVYTKERRNVFDNETMDLSQLHVGKKRDSDVLRDRSFIEQMKADILRRAEEISDDEDEESRRVHAEDDMPDDDAVPLGTARLKIAGDGESSEDEDTEGEDGPGEDVKPPSVETILELTYLRDPSLFDRDAQTRRGKARADLKAQTGWSDEQIEGWRIMLERNPRKDKILATHEFRGNQNDVTLAEPGPSRGGHGGGRGSSGRGHHRGGRGGGRGRGRGGGGTEGGDARERAMNDRHKASRANHNRKRGHDKKMARMGGPSS